MAAVLGIIVVKEFTYRDDPTEEWSSRYHFTAPPPGPPENWNVLFDDLCAQEVLCYPSTSKVVRCYGYDSDDPKAPAAYVRDFAAEGITKPGQLLTPPASYKMAGDQAAVIWAKTAHRNARGKNVYLRKYMHDGFGDLADRDKLSVNYRTALQDFGNKIAGGTIASLGVWRPQKYDTPLITNDVEQWVTTRTLKRRGKRPPTPA